MMCVKFFVLAAVLLVYACSSDSWVKVENSGDALGTTYSIIYFAPERVDYQEGIDSVFRVVNASLSTYLSTSAISKINQGDSSVVVDEMFREVFSISSEVYEASQGFFDPTLGVLTNAWGFGSGGLVRLDSAKVDSLLAYVGWHKIGLNEDGTVKKADPAICFDFNGVAKGYAVDRLGVLLAAKGLKNYLVEVGGEVLAKGKNVISAQPWKVGVDDPQGVTGRRVKRIVFLQDKALASSGNYRKFWIDPQTGERYVHILDPKTGYPKSSNVLAASVVAGSCAVADAYATAFMVMDLEVSKAVLQRQRLVEGYLIYLDKNGDAQEFMTSGFKEMVYK